MRHPFRCGLRRCGVAGLVAVAAALLSGASAPAAGGLTAATASPVPVVLVGVTGLRWTDVTEATTPTLWQLVGSSAVGSTQVRSARQITCPADGWLSVSAGVKATSSDVALDRDPLNPGQPAATGPVACEPMTVVTDGHVADWSDYLEVQREAAGAYGTPGMLGDLLSRAGVCASAIGPGAAVALADLEGDVASYADTWTATIQGACPITVVDAGMLGESPGKRSEQLAQLDVMVGQVTEAAAAGTHVIVTGVADPSASPPPLQVGIEHVVGRRAPTWLTSESTRGQLGIVALSDVTATLLTRSGVTYDRLEGTPWEAGQERDLTVEQTVEDRRDVGQLSDVIPDDGPVFGAWVAAVPIAVLVGCLLVLVARRRGYTWAARPVFTRLAVGAALFGAALPTALYLVTAVRWWERDHPTLVLGVVSVIVALAIAAASAYAAIRGPWRFVAVQCGVTYAALTVDGVIGTPLQVGSLLGAGPVYGGRFYGFGNVTFTVYATATLLLAAAAAQVLTGRGNRRGAVAAAAGIGTVAIVVDGWPTFGADFGGIIALVPGVVLLVLLVAAVRLTYARLAAVGLTGILVVALVAYLDYLRPADARSHMGEFVAKLLAGDAGELLSNKLAALGASLASPLGWAELLTFSLATAIVARPEAMHVPELGRVYVAWPLLRPGLLAIALTCAVGTFVNDSGALIAGLGVLTTAPLLIATCVWWTTLPAPASPKSEPVPAGRA